MFSLRALLASAPLLVLAAAANIGFTHTPAELVAGETFNITWAGGDDSGVTLILRQGNPADLSTVDTIADNVETDYYLWTVPSDLETADDYALQIVQGQTGINYSGLFSITGGSANSTSSASSTATATGMSNSTATMTGMGSAAGTGTAMTRNSTFSTATLTSTSSTYDFNSMTSTTSGSSATRMPSSASTSAPSNDAPVRAGSSAALVLGIVAAVMLH